MMFLRRHIYFLILNASLILTPAYAESGAEIYEANKDSIFTVYSIDEEKDIKYALGSGVAVTEHLIATNCHVALAGSILVIKVNGEPLLGRLLYYKQKKDLCLIEMVGTTLKPVKIRLSKTVKIGEEVFAIGNPEGRMKTISKGIISNKHLEDGTELLQTDASISHGSSGGGLFDTDGNLIGITTMASKEGENIGFAIPTELITYAIGSDVKSSSSIDRKNNKHTPSNNSVVTQTSYQNTLNENKINYLGYYGDDKISLMSWQGECFIGIVGRYKDKPTSLAVWFPYAPNGMFIFSHIDNAEKAIEYFIWINDKKNIKYPESKSFLYFDKQLYPLQIMVVNDAKQRAYVFTMNSEITEELIELDDFVAQFYRYNQDNGMTTIKFGLSGFTEAFGEYNKKCK